MSLMSYIKKPQGEGKLILYLDFDGVLHHENVLWHPRRGAYLDAPKEFTLFQWAPLLEDILAPYPDIRIVLSTSWVRWYSYTGARKRLPAGLQSRCIGATYHSEMEPNLFQQASRGMQVWSDVLRRKPKDWIALDDDHFGWPRWAMDNYVRTHEIRGFTEPVPMQQLLEKLGRMGGPDNEIPT